MKKLFLFLIPVLFLFSSCNFLTNNPDTPGEYEVRDCSNYIKDTYFKFPPKTDSVDIFNCLYSEYGFCDKEITGLYSHTETATLNGKLYYDTITKNIVRMKIYSKINSNPTTSDFYVVFTTDTGETLQYLYRWHFYKTSYWHNDISTGEITINK